LNNHFQNPRLFSPPGTEKIKGTSFLQAKWILGDKMKTYKSKHSEKELVEIIDEVNESSEPILIKVKKKNAILLSEREWESIKETLELTNIPGFRKTLLEGEKEKIEEGTKLKDLDW